jgi:hypothetical protein
MHALMHARFFRFRTKRSAERVHSPVKRLNRKCNHFEFLQQLGTVSSRRNYLVTLMNHYAGRPIRLTS